MRYVTIAFGVLVLLALAAVAPGQTTPDPAPAPEPAATPLPEIAIPAPIPDSAKRMKNPVPKSEEAVERGYQLFASQCAMCHGANGNGRGELAARLAVPMPDFTDREAQAGRTDGELFYIVTHGHGRMPADGERLPEEWRWSMIHAIRAMARPER